MWVKVISRFRHPETGQYHDPGKKVNLRGDLVRRYVEAGCVAVMGKEPSENKAKVPTENKGAG